MKDGKRLNPKLASAYGTIQRELGRAAERVVTESFEQQRNEGAFPEWLYGFKNHESHSKEDCEEKDFTFHTDIGPVFVNIKSSRMGVRNFEQKTRSTRIVAVAIDIRQDNLKIFRRILGAIAKERLEIMALRNRG